jgi:hypothetical protein
LGASLKKIIVLAALAFMLVAGAAATIQSTRTHTPAAPPPIADRRATMRKILLFFALGFALFVGQRW